MSKARITIFCPSCGHKNNDVLLEKLNSTEDDLVSYINQNHVCPGCGMGIRIFADRDWDYVSVTAIGTYEAPQRHLTGVTRDKRSKKEGEK